MKKYYKTILIFLTLSLLMFPIKTKAITKTTFHLENPNNNQILSNDMVISGWLMTESTSPTIHMYIDDNEITPTINRFYREDVLKANLSYSRNQNNMQAGFNTKISTLGYTDGKHILTINILDHNKNEVLSQCSLIFYVDKYKTAFNLESPKGNTKYASNIEVGGWLMTESNNPIINVYIDNEKITSTINRIARKDVNRSYPNYSNNTNNQKPGFKAIIETSNYLDGKHDLTIEILDESSNEILKKISVPINIEKTKSILHIEQPSNNINTKKMIEVSGWLMTTNKNAKIEYFINDSKISTEEVRSTRPDVIKAISNYGDATTNPTPGFKTQIDLSQYKDGNYNLEVRIIDSNNNEILTRDNRKIILKKYDGYINIESPSENEELGTKIILGGWYLSEYSESKLEIYIDDQLIENDITSITRPDVIKALGKSYGGESTTSKPGFKSIIDSSDISDGTHILKVKVINPQTNEEITSAYKKIRINKNKTTMNLESPKGLQKGNINISGWYLSLNTNNYIKAFIDDDEIECEIKRIERKDVIKAISGYGNENINPTPGFSMNYNIKNYKDGNHTITVKVYDSKTNQVIGNVSTSITLKKYEGKLNIETPQLNELENRNGKISGWSMTTDDNDSIRVLIDNKVVETVIRRTTRKDVIRAISDYGDESINPTPGFSTEVNLSEYKDGNHTLTIQAIDNNTDDVIEQKSTTFKLKKYDGKVHIELPQTSMLNEDHLVIAGWEKSELDNSYVEIYIDDVKRNAQIARFARDDVISGVSEYGTIVENATPGFNTTLDISDLKEGKHRIKIKLFTKLNEEIAETTKDIIKYNNVYFGIDVSYYNGSIDWSAVRNDGISFAIIRAGYRGYGTGAMVEDDMFKTNITNALANNISCGVYFYTQAINENEAISEADFTVGKLQEYGVLEKLKLPIVIDTEFTDVRIGRADGLTQQQRTQVIKAFAKRIKQHGYTPMIYASRDFLYFNLMMSELSEYDVWLAHYTSATDPMNHPSNYNGPYKIWQYTSSGTVSGIKGNVDRNIAYVKY